ncbi:MAG TPA: hypothetical protein H9966_08220, partial [Candidatus Prevotella avicola]|nr:hypothetical protein [Candidatus Prevotella avicola]
RYLPSEVLGQDSRRDTFPAKFWDKIRAAIPSQRSFGTRIVPRYLPSEVLGQESCRDTFPAKFWDKIRAAIPSQRSFGTRFVPRYLPSEVLDKIRAIPNIFSPTGIRHPAIFRIFAYDKGGKRTLPPSMNHKAMKI